MTSTRLAAAIAAIASLALASPAFAVTRYVDEDGAGNPPCDSTANPCNTISEATGTSSSGDVIQIGGDVYVVAATLPPGVSLVEANFNPALTADNGAQAEINGGAGVGVTMSAGSGAQLSGLTVEGDADAVQILVGNGGTTVSLTGNTFPSADTDNDARVFVVSNTGTANLTFDGNNWDSPLIINANLNRKGLDSSANGTVNATVRNNTFDGFSDGILFAGSDPLISGNTFTRVYEDIAAGIRHAIRLIDSSGVIENNTIRAANDSGEAISVDNTSGVANESPVLRRNHITDFDSSPIRATGTAAGADSLTVTDSVLESELSGIVAFGLGGGITASGLTIAGGTAGSGSMFLDDSNLSLDSSTVEQVIQTAGTTTCAIAFSRGPLTAAPGDPTDCSNDFQTSAAPGFVDDPNDDYRLAPGSPLIETGNPAAPAAGSLDLGGTLRAQDGNGDGVARRDIGAYEVGDTFPPETTLDKKPKKKVRAKKKKAKVKLEFSSSEAGATFACKVDKADFVPCTSAFGFKAKVGKHTVQVRAVDAVGNVDATPASASFKVARKK